MMAASWRQIVYEYSGLSLTLVSDQLLAISEIARAMSKVRNRPYYGGIWKNVLVEDMIWIPLIQRPGRQSGGHRPGLGLL